MLDALTAAGRQTAFRSPLRRRSTKYEHAQMLRAISSLVERLLKEGPDAETVVADRRRLCGCFARAVGGKAADRGRGDRHDELHERGRVRDYPRRRLPRNMQRHAHCTE